MKSLQLFIVILSILCNVGFTGIAQHYKHPVFSISEKDYQSNQYYIFQNKYNHSIVKYTFGECKVTADAGKAYPLVNNALLRVYDPRWVQAENVQGENWSIAPLSSTKSVYIDNTNDSLFLEYYGTMSYSWDEINYALNQPNCKGMCDNVSFKIQIIDDITKLTLFETEPVEFKKTDSNGTDPRLGTESKKVNHKLLLPNTIKGRTIFARVISSRTGDSQYGIVLEEKDSWINLSAITDEFGRTAKNERFSELYELWWDAFKFHKDSVEPRTKEIYSQRWIPPTHRKEFDEYMFKDWKVDTINGIPTKYKVNSMLVDTSALSKKTLLDIYNNPGFLELSPVPAKDFINFKLNLQTKSLLKIYIADIGGGVYESIIEKIFEQGTSSFNYKTHNLSTGTYIISVLDENANLMSMQKILIEK